MTEAKCKNERKTTDQKTHEPQSLCREVDHREAAEIAGRTSELQRANEALRESEGRLRLLADALPVFISYVDADQRYRFNNKAYEETYGISREQMHGGHIKDVLGDERYERVREGVEAALTGERIRREITMTFPGDDTRILEANYVPDTAEDGRVRGFFFLATDITEHKRTEEALREARDTLELRVRERTAELREANEGLAREVARRASSEAALRESKEWFSSFVSNIAGAVYRCACDKDWTMEFMSEAIQGICGYPASDFLENRVRSYASVIHPDDLAMVEDTVLQAVDRKQPFTIRYRIHNAKGEVRWVWERGTGVFDDGGRLRYLDGAIFDVTAQRRVEEALRESEERFRTVVDHSPAKIHIKDLEGRYLLVNKEAEELFGVSDEEARGRTSAEIFPQERAEAFGAHDRAVLEAGHAIEEEEEWVREDGVHTYLTVKFPIRDAAGKAVAIGAIGTDITERKRTEEALRDSEARLRAVIDTAGDGVILIDAAGTVRLYNRACERLFGYKADEVIGQNVKMLMPPPYSDEHNEYLRKYLETGERRLIGIGREVVGWRKDGTTVPLELSVGEMNQGGTHAFVGIMRDISDRKLLESQRLHAEKMEALGVLASGIAHEFNNMLFAMIGLTESVRNALPEGNEERADLEGVLEAGERAQELVRQILAFSRQDEAHPHPVDLQHVLTGAIRLVRATLPATIAIRQTLDKISRPVLVDPTHVHQIFLNLASNAADAMKENGGLLDVRLDQVIADDRLIARLPELTPGPYARLTVRDTGCGMDDRILGRIFDPFFTTKEVGVGTGMGLAAVHGIVESYSGAIDVSSSLGRGTTFEIYLPLWAGENEETLPGDATRSEDLAGVGA